MEEEMDISGLKLFAGRTLNAGQIEFFRNFASKARRDTLRMVVSAGSGHIGGSLSSIDIYSILWACADLAGEKPDSVVISHGHTSAAAYAVLGNLGLFDVEDAVEGFRGGDSIFEGHPSRNVPGVEWCSGSLGQGLSVGCGLALAAKMKKDERHTFVVMGDGEQSKGQLQEAREFAVKFNLGNLTAIVDFNNLQSSGGIQEVMPQNIVEKYAAAGWDVLEVDGHDYNAVYQAFRQSRMDRETPVLILAHTVMGKGVAKIENNHVYHGKMLTEEELASALEQLDYSQEALDVVPYLRRDNKQIASVEPAIRCGEPIVYESDIECRSAFGEALLSLARENENVPFAVLDCDLADSVKVSQFGKAYPQRLVECGIQEHNAATVAGALSTQGILTFWADFGVFGIDEVYSQLRMNDLNHTALKLVCTHNGLDVGEDGKTHQCIDCLGLLANLFGFRIIIPADANQTDRAVRYAASKQGNVAILMGRSKTPVLRNEDGDVWYGSAYAMQYGQADWLREGRDATVVTCGAMAYRAVNVSDGLRKEGLDVGVLNLPCPTMLDEPKLEEAVSTGLIVTYEDHHINTGIGNIIGCHIAEKGYKCRFERLGITEYGVSASPQKLYQLQGLDENTLASRIKSRLTEK